MRQTEREREAHVRGKQVARRRRRRRKGIFPRRKAFG